MDKGNSEPDIIVKDNGLMENETRENRTEENDVSVPEDNGLMKNETRENRTEENDVSVPEDNELMENETRENRTEENDVSVPEDNGLMENETKENRTEENDVSVPEDNGLMEDETRDNRTEENDISVIEDNGLMENETRENRTEENDVSVPEDNGLMEDETRDNRTEENDVSVPDEIIKRRKKKTRRGGRRQRRRNKFAKYQLKLESQKQNEQRMIALKIVLCQTWHISNLPQECTVDDIKSLLSFYTNIDVENAYYYIEKQICCTNKGAEGVFIITFLDASYVEEIDKKLENFVVLGSIGLKIMRVTDFHMLSSGYFHRFQQFLTEVNEAKLRGINPIQMRLHQRCVDAPQSAKNSYKDNVRELLNDHEELAKGTKSVGNSSENKELIDRESIAVMYESDSGSDFDDIIRLGQAAYDNAETNIMRPTADNSETKISEKEIDVKQEVTEETNTIEQIAAYAYELQKGKLTDKSNETDNAVDDMQIKTEPIDSNDILVSEKSIESVNMLDDTKIKTEPKESNDIHITDKPRSIVNNVDDTQIKPEPIDSNNVKITDQSHESVISHNTDIDSEPMNSQDVQIIDESIEIINILDNTEIKSEPINSKDVQTTDKNNEIVMVDDIDIKSEPMDSNDKHINDNSNDTVMLDDTEIKSESMDSNDVQITDEINSIPNNVNDKQTEPKEANNVKTCLIENIETLHSNSGETHVRENRIDILSSPDEVDYIDLCINIADNQVLSPRKVSLNSDRQNDPALSMILKQQHRPNEPTVVAPRIINEASFTIVDSEMQPSESSGVKESITTLKSILNKPLVRIKNLPIPDSVNILRKLIMEKTEIQSHLEIHEIKTHKDYLFGQCFVVLNSIEEAIHVTRVLHGIKIQNKIIYAKKFSGSKLQNYVDWKRDSDKAEQLDRELKRKSQSDDQSSNSESADINGDETGITTAKRLKPLESTHISYENLYLPPEKPDWDDYGLHPTFLEKLGLKLPLKNRIFVYKLDEAVTEAKLREVFSLAGEIRKMTYNLNENKATIEYDHPVEAVQAISMFHKHTLYNKAMHVTMDVSFAKRELPSGLLSIGRGLDRGGEPLKRVGTVMAVRETKDLLSGMGKMIKYENKARNAPFKYCYKKIINPSEKNNLNVATDTSTINLTVTSSDPGQDNRVPNLQFPVQSQSAIIPPAPTNNSTDTLSKLKAVLKNKGLIPEGIECNDIGDLIKVLESEPIRSDINVSESQHVNNMFAANNVIPNNMREKQIPVEMLKITNTITMPGMRLPGPQFIPSPQVHWEQPSNFNRDPRNAKFFPNVPDQISPAPVPPQYQHFDQYVHNTMNSQNIAQPPIQLLLNPSSSTSLHQNSIYAPQNLPRPHILPEQSGMPMHPPQQSCQHHASGDSHVGASSTNIDSKNQPSAPSNVSQHSTLSDEGQLSEENKVDKTTLFFRNLPPSVDQDALSSKMEEVGDVVFCRMFDQGRACVRFKTAQDSNRCHRLFHRSKVDGQVIDVAYIYIMDKE